MRQILTIINPWDALAQISKWSIELEAFLKTLREDGERSDEQRRLLNHWINKCRRLHRDAEKQLEGADAKNQSAKLASVTRQFYQYAHQLHAEVHDNLQKEMYSISDVQPVSDHQEPVVTEAANLYTEPGYRPVPIGGHVLPPLPYPYDALEPHIDEKTMRLHHDIHHKSYVEGLNQAEKEMQKARDSGDFSLIKHWEREAAFNGAGHYLHTLFWNNMSPSGGGKPKGELAEEINRTFGNFEKFKKHFSSAAEKVEGSGWTLLVWAPRSHRVEILQAEKHQNLSQWDIIPLMALDVWEHAYYLKYQDKRKDYIDAWWNVVYWDYINQRYLHARRLRWRPY